MEVLADAYVPLLGGALAVPTPSYSALFTMGIREFTMKLRARAASGGLPRASAYTSHSLRRGMAQDVLDAGGSLAVLLHADDWLSSAYKAYLRVQQPEEVALSKAVIYLSDSDDDV